MKNKVYLNKNLFWNSFFYFGCFYIILFLVQIIICNNKDYNFSNTLFWIFLGNLIIVFITQLIHLYNYEQEKKENKKETKESEEKKLFTDYKHEIYLKCLKEEEKGELEAKELFYGTLLNCTIRCFSGILEMTFYTIFFAFGRWEIVAGYLLLKGLSTWKPKSKSPKSITKEGISTAGLRIAVVLSLIFALWASRFLNQYLYIQNIRLNQHSLFIK